MAGSQRCHRSSGDADFPQHGAERRATLPWHRANSPIPVNQQPALNWHISARLGPVPRREPRRCWQPWPPVPLVGDRAGTGCGGPPTSLIFGMFPCWCHQRVPPKQGVTRVTPAGPMGVTPRPCRSPSCQRESKELPRTPQPFLLISLTPLPRCIVTMGCN